MHTVWQTLDPLKVIRGVKWPLLATQKVKGGGER